MKKFLLSLVAIFAMSSLAFAQGKADFSTIEKANSSYGSPKTTNGWKGVNCAVLEHGTSDSNPKFKFITEGEKALCLNGKTSAVGTITSPTLEGGIGILSFQFGHPYSESKGVNITISVKQNGTVVASTDLVQTSVTKVTAYDFEHEFNVSGDFVIEIKNNSPSKSTSNKDRVAIWNLEWTGHVSGGNEVQKPFSPAFSLGEGTYYEAQSVELSCATEGATIYYCLGDEFDAGEAIVYTAPISITETTTIHACAIKDDVQSNIATATYTIVEPEALENVEAFYAVASSTGKAVKLINPLTVIYQSYNNLIVKDETGTMLIFGSTSKKYQNGDVITGVVGTVAEYGKNPQLAPVSTMELPDATQGTVVEPKAVTVAELADCNFLDYVKVEDVTFTLDSGKTKNYTLSNGSESFAVYNQFNLTINNLGDGNLFDVTGFVSSYNGKTQFQPTSVVYDDIATGIEDTMVDENAPVEYYNLQGVKVANPENGIFIKKQGGRTSKVVL